MVSKLFQVISKCTMANILCFKRARFRRNNIICLHVFPFNLKYPILILIDELHSNSPNRPAPLSFQSHFHEPQQISNKSFFLKFLPNQLSFDILLLWLCSKSVKYFSFFVGYLQSHFHQTQQIPNCSFIFNFLSTYNHLTSLITTLSSLWFVSSCPH